MIPTMQKEWKLRQQVPSEIRFALGTTDLEAQLLFNRGIRTSKQRRNFLEDSSGPYHDPFLLPDMGQAIIRLVQAINSHEKIGIFGDFDVDGITATAILVQGLKPLEAKLAPYIPHRVEEGHGLNAGAIQVLHQSDVKLLITVDCGITSVPEVAQASDLNMDVIITDHHSPPPLLPAAHSLIDPKLKHSSYPFSDLTGAGLALKLIDALYKYLKRELTPGLRGLAAIGTIADVAPLIDENRTIVKQGLLELKSNVSLGMQSLYETANLLPESLNTEAISFSLAPRLNASGRLHHAETSFNLLTTSNPKDAKALAIELEKYNSERRSMTDTLLDLALEKIGPIDDASIILVSDKEFVPGISGLIASRLVDRFYRPAVVMSLAGSTIRASGRSIPEFDLVQSLYQCADLFERMGGHPMAAGFVMNQVRLQELYERLTDAADQQFSGSKPIPSIWIDCEMTPSDLMGDPINLIDRLEPFGSGNPAPTFLAKSILVKQTRLVGNRKQHLMLKLHDGHSQWNAIAFNQGQDVTSERIDMVYNITKQIWQGRQVMSIRILDFHESTSRR